MISTIFNISQFSLAFSEISVKFVLMDKFHSDDWLIVPKETLGMSTTVSIPELNAKFIV